MIETEIIKNADNRLILLMLGPTAKVIVAGLVAQLTNQMIDIGHIDSEYEWMKMGATSKVKFLISILLSLILTINKLN